MTAPITALANGRKERNGPRSIGTAALAADCCRVGLAHGTELFKGCVTIAAMVFVQRHVTDPLSDNLSEIL